VNVAFRVDGDAYDDFMGRYATELAPLFAQFAGVDAGERALDVGAGTGALTAALIRRGATVAAADPSPEFAIVLRERFPGLEVEEAPAESLPWGAGVFDVALAQLVVAFVSDGPAAVAEMARVARRVAVCMWGIAEVDMFAAIDRTAAAVGVPRAAEPRRYRTAQEIHDLLAPHGKVESAELDVQASYQDFEEFWQTLGRLVGPAGHWVGSLDPAARERAHDELFRQLGSPTGPFELKARAFAAAVTPRGNTKGTVFSGSSDAYDRFMGRYSTPLAARFADFAGVGSPQRALDVGAGTGALTDELARRLGQENVAAAEPSPDYAATLRARFPQLDVREAPAEELPWEDGSFDVALAQLVVVFLNDAPRAVRELARVTRSGGVVATCMWVVEGVEMINALNEIRRRLSPDRASITTDYRDEASLRRLFEQAGLGEVETTPIEVSVEYETVDELWEPAIRVGGPGGPAVDSFTPEQLVEGRAIFEEALGNPAGRFSLTGRAVAVRGISG